MDIENKLTPHIIKYSLLAIVILAFLLRFWGVWDKDMIGDEAAYSFRSVGYLDYLGTSSQTQPVEWYKGAELPFWTKLSFHDHPPLTFIIQNVFFRIFGDSLWSARLPSAVFGSLSVIFIYLIANILFSLAKCPDVCGKDGGEENPSVALAKGGWFLKFDGKFIGLLAALIFSLNNGLIGISRTALMEPILLFLILANIYSFLCLVKNFELKDSSFCHSRSSICHPRANEARPGDPFLDSRFRGNDRGDKNDNSRSLIIQSKNQNWWWIFGATLGLSLLTKYTAIFLIPLYFIYLIFFERKLFKNYRLYLSLLLALLIFSPVLIYNYFLFQKTGHFDLQFSYLLGQATPEWSGLLGKAQDGFGGIIKNLLKTFGLIDLLMFLGGLVYIFFIFIKNKSRELLFLFIYLIVLTLLLVKMGSAPRFLALYSPVFVIFSALFIRFLWQFSQEKIGILFKAIAVIFIISALSFSIRENLFRRDVNNFGIAGLDNFLGQEIDKINPAFMPQTDNNHLNAIIEKTAADKNDVGIQQPVLIVYNDNVAITTLQWIVYRRFFYHALPFYYVENFIDTVNKNPQEIRGTLVYFIQSTQNTLLNPFKRDKIAGDTFENDLVRQGIAPIKIIYGNNNLEMFKIYKLSL
ncbi:MAG: glycosyltransferase family 39 protein [bacterium]|nr:glycosyltransferase family 39 protein [bacterium]